MPIPRAVLAMAIAVACALSGVGTVSQQAAGSTFASGPATEAGRGDASASQPGTATISGTVVTLASSEPIVDATVTLYASTLASGRTSITTDGQGRFQFDHLAAGRYTVGAVKAGFVNVWFGERQSGRGALAIPLRDAEDRDIRLQLPHTNVITGRIVDERGNPAINASVRAVRFSMAFGYRRADSAAGAQTDDRGVFRIHSLTPGDYAVCVWTHETGPLSDSQRLRMEIDRERRFAAFDLSPEGPARQRALAPHLAALEAQLPPVRPSCSRVCPNLLSGFHVNVCVDHTRVGRGANRRGHAIRPHAARPHRRKRHGDAIRQPGSGSDHVVRH